ncbi:protein translocase subunit SecD [Desulfovibrio sp. OttesenSCG-928-C14]|nr:protein translocase subunit SecD [Desulfovibrio sp. OttesenSCG-928-C14]
MKQRNSWRVALTLAVLILAAAYLLPSFTSARDGALSKVLPDAKINLGLDLMGGIYLALGVDVNVAVENTLAQEAQGIRADSREKGIAITRPRLEKGAIHFNLAQTGQKANLDRLLAEQYSGLSVTTQNLPDGSLRYNLAFSDARRKEIETQALDMALQTIRNRIDQFGVAEPDIRKQESDNRIIVQLPGLSDTQRAIQILKQTAHLEFKMEKQLSALEMERAGRGILPPGTEALPRVGRESAPGLSGTIIVEREPVLTGEYIETAFIDYDNLGRPGVGLRFNRRGADIFSRVTEENVGRNMAIILDGKVHSAPVINEKISQGRASISGSFTQEEATDLALVLRAGSLPAPVQVLEERTVGPSLGQQSIDNGVRAALIGLALVVGFIIVYYSVSGLIAALMLALDISLLLAGMAGFGATLTLPGIAGIVLTIGMAVDANVLIFERIREELRKGISPLRAVDLGFGRATLTIFDSNLTTIIAAIILYQFGTGPVRGFAVTLSLGIIVSMFTAIFVSRTIFNLWISEKSTRISI